MHRQADSHEQHELWFCTMQRINRHVTASHPFFIAGLPIQAPYLHIPVMRRVQRAMKVSSAPKRAMKVMKTAPKRAMKAMKAAPKRAMKAMKAAPKTATKPMKSRRVKAKPASRSGRSGWAAWRSKLPSDNNEPCAVPVQKMILAETDNDEQNDDQNPREKATQTPVFIRRLRRARDKEDSCCGQIELLNLGTHFFQSFMSNP